jgi:phosphoglycolate phosphatase
VRILEKFQLAHCFAGIDGDKLEYPSHSKIDLLARILSEHSLGPDNAWMVGDRTFDIDAAHANNIRCLAAAWGYGTSEEWSQADAVAATPADVAGIVAPSAPRSVRSS